MATDKLSTSSFLFTRYALRPRLLSLILQHRSSAATSKTLSMRTRLTVRTSPSKRCSASSRAPARRCVRCTITACPSIPKPGERTSLTLRPRRPPLPCRAPATRALHGILSTTTTRVQGCSRIQRAMPMVATPTIRTATRRARRCRSWRATATTSPSSTGTRSSRGYKTARVARVKRSSYHTRIGT